MESISSDGELVLILLNQKREKLRFWVHPVLNRRQLQGEFHGLIQELKLYHGCFRTYLRMSVRHFECLLKELGPHLRKREIISERRLWHNKCSSMLNSVFVWLMRCAYTHLKHLQNQLDQKKKKWRKFFLLILLNPHKIFAWILCLWSINV